jgi:ABC-type bacteriocin/lantibiotic exporter with double-glycine peptidase domain
LLIFGAGVIISFVYGWELTLVVLACSPLLVLSGAAKAVVMKGFKKTQEDTAAANQVATEAISNIRTVASFTYGNKFNFHRVF